MRRLGFGVVASLSFMGSATAEFNCATPPTCEELGFNQTEADCEGYYFVRCPFDETKVFCGDTDNIGGESVDCSDYPLTEQNATGCSSYESCTSGDTTQYRCAACDEGFELLSGQCEADCSDYPLTEQYEYSCLSYESCTSAGTTKYRCTECGNGYYVHPSTYECTPNTCSGFQDNGYGFVGCLNYDTCLSGEEETYRCSGPCVDGYTFVPSSGSTYGRCVGSGCVLGSILYSDGNCYFNQTPSGLQEVGFVFDEDNHLVIRRSLASNLRWAPSGSDISTITQCGSTPCPDGHSNTAEIVSVLGDTSNYAAGFCYNLTDGGKSKGDWWLPSREELSKFIDVQDKINGHNGSYYLWTSERNGGSYSAYTIHYPDGASSSSTASSTYPQVWCITSY